MTDKEASSSSQPTALDRSKLSYASLGKVPIAKLHEIVRPTLVSNNKHLRNWGGSFVCQPSRLFAPTNVEQCCAIVELARRIGGIEVRAIGRSHSPGDIVFTKDWIIKMDGLKGLLSIDSSVPSVTVLAGTFVSDIHAILESATPPLSMSNVGSISEQTIGGLISTATHGTGINQPVISAAVRSMRVACPLTSEQGGTKILVCSRKENADLFNATLCGLGATGLILEVTMEVEHLFKLKQVSEECPFDFVFGNRSDSPSIDASLIEDEFNVTAVRNAKIHTEASPHRRSIGNLLAHGHRLSPARNCYRPTTRNSDPSQIHPVTLDTSTSRESEEEDDEVTRAAQKRLEAIIHSSQFVRILWFPTVGVCTVMRADRSLEPFQTPGVFARWQQNIIGHRLTELLLFLGRYNNNLPPIINRGVHYLTAPRQISPRKGRHSQDNDEASHKIELGSITEVETLDLQPPSSASNGHLANLDTFGSGGTFKPLELATAGASTGPEPLDPNHATTTLVDTSYRVFNVDCLFTQYTDEWAIPLEHAASAIRAMRDWLEEEERLRDGERVHFPVEIRFADGDGIWMSHCQGRKTCFIGLTKYRPYDRPVRYRKLFSKFEELMRHYSGRPHWAKAHSCGPAELQRLYPHMQDYIALIQKVDPEGVFRNPYIRRHLFGQLTDDASPRVFKSRL